MVSAAQLNLFGGETPVREKLTPLPSTASEYDRVVIGITKLVLADDNSNTRHIITNKYQTDGCDWYVIAGKEVKEQTLSRGAIKRFFYKRKIRN